MVFASSVSLSGRPIIGACGDAMWERVGNGSVRRTTTVRRVLDADVSRVTHSEIAPPETVLIFNVPGRNKSIRPPGLRPGSQRHRVSRGPQHPLGAG